MTDMKTVPILLALLLSVWTGKAQVRTEQTLDKGWRFTRDDCPSFASAACDDTAWQPVTLPHDWAIYGPFSIGNDLQNTAIAQDGQKEAMEHAGRTGGLPFVGTGWYRRTIEIDGDPATQRYTLLFDGAMSHARVYINGREACYWPNGYNSFWFDATPYLHEGRNTLAVRLENLPESSRWYPGAGLYRNVHLIRTGAAHIPVWGTQIVTPVATEAYAEVRQTTQP